MDIRRTIIFASLVSLTLTSGSFAAGYEVITPKPKKAAEKKQITEPDTAPSKPAPAFQPETLSSSPCPDETAWLLSTVPMTSTDKSDDKISRSSGNAFLPEDMQKELINIAAKENISMKDLCARLNNYKTKLEEYIGDPQEYNRQRMLILEEMLDCRKSCGKILNKFAAIYTESSRVYFSGIVRFNSGSRKVIDSFNGDKSHGQLQINNAEQLKNALSRWKRDPSQRIQLDARSSIPGSTDVNDKISRNRAEAVMGWLTAQGVPASQIAIRWLGKYGPLINRPVAVSYNIESIFNDYRNSNARQSTSLIGSQGVESFYDGLNQSVAIFVLP